MGSRGEPPQRRKAERGPCLYGACPESPNPLTLDPRACRKRIKDPTRNIFDQIANLAHGVQRATAAQPLGFGFSLVGTLARPESVPG